MRTDDFIDYEARAKNEGRVKDPKQPCFLCGRGVNMQRPHMIHLTTDGRIAKLYERVPEASDQGWYPIGPECAKKLPPEYVERESPPVKLKCYECEQRKPQGETTMIGAMIGGDYRRAARHGSVRVCRDCAQAHLDFCVKAQAENRTFAVNTGRMTWTTALARFGIAIPSGTLIDRMTGRRAA